MPIGILTIVEEKLPFGSLAWDWVAKEYNAGLRQDDYREREDLKGKFTRLKNAKSRQATRRAPTLF
ncbi:hypothetical protein PsorP6_010212 [Peronosclerospora sorghi]|uniref:Uncharacterized protein n=1 Tax=Peronosclerospora sorghi TaxID=230839 RepID=A0ACC0VTC0_9STRA|nr:hypothetical protein PsorP6_010212 [Peronosclerospora sorghi]